VEVPVVASGPVVEAAVDEVVEAMETVVADAAVVAAGMVVALELVTAVPSSPEHP